MLEQDSYEHALMLGVGIRSYKYNYVASQKVLRVIYYPLIVHSIRCF